VLQWLIQNFICSCLQVFTVTVLQFSAFCPEVLVSVQKHMEFFWVLTV